MNRIRVPVGSAAYNEVVEFLYDEAALLDNQQLREWGALMAEDLSYTAPLRVTRSDDDGRVVVTTKHFDDDYLSMMGRLGRLEVPSAWSEDPPARCRRLVTNIRVWRTDLADELEAQSNLLLTRARYENYEYQLLTAARTDRLRRASDGGFKIARREVIVDQSTLGVPNLSVFL